MMLPLRYTFELSVKPCQQLFEEVLDALSKLQILPALCGGSRGELPKVLPRAPNWSGPVSGAPPLKSKRLN